MVGERVRECRAEQGISLKKAAAQAGIAFSTWSRIENGHVDPETATLQKIAGVLGVTVQELRGEVGSGSEFDRVLIQSVRRLRPEDQRDALVWILAHVRAEDQEVGEDFPDAMTRVLEPAMAGDE